MQIGTFNKTEHAHRALSAGGHVMTALPAADMIDVFPSKIPALQFTAHMHIFYSEKVLKIADGLPKFKDLPADLGGSGEMVPD
jgi:hypothetical protein